MPETNDAKPRDLPWTWQAGLALGYLLCFLALDWVSYIHPLQGLNITPWNPQPALAVALLIWNRRWLWLVWASYIAADLVVRGTPVHWLASLGATGMLSLTCAAMARAMQVRLNRSMALATWQDLAWFSAIIVIGSLLGGLCYVAIFATAGFGPAGSLPMAVARYWVGDAVGLLVVLPMLLVLMDRPHRARLPPTVNDPQVWLIVALIAALLWLMFNNLPSDRVRYFYLLLLPVVWAAARLGVVGAVMAAGLTQIGLIMGVLSDPRQDLALIELQVLLAAITMTALMLGVAVDQKERAQIELRNSLGLAAAGQMAAALAHELSQPLTALRSYAQATRWLLDAPALAPAQRSAQLADVALRLEHDAQRASDVVKRLREFFRSGSTLLQPVPAADLVKQAVDAQRRRADALGVRLDCELSPALPTLFIDRVQMDLVLRNLLANALEAATGSPQGAQVRVRASQASGALRLDIQDSGPGVPGPQWETLFESATSSKPGGMGVGLRISRAIVHAHGGRLWAEPGPFGLFCLTLPADPPSDDSVHDAR